MNYLSLKGFLSFLLKLYKRKEGDVGGVLHWCAFQRGWRTSSMRADAVEPGKWDPLVSEWRRSTRWLPLDLGRRAEIRPLTIEGVCNGIR